MYHIKRTLRHIRAGLNTVIEHIRVAEKPVAKPVFTNVNMPNNCQLPYRMVKIFSILRAGALKPYGEITNLFYHQPPFVNNNTANFNGVSIVNRK